MENAIRYNRPGGRIKICISQTDRWTEVLIANTAIPIPPQQAAHIFQRFYRATGGVDASGHGLGLSIARELAGTNLGKLELVSSDEQWTLFRLLLPNAAANELDVQPAVTAAK